MLYYLSLLKNTCVRRVVLDKWFPLNAEASRGYMSKFVAKPWEQRPHASEMRMGKWDVMRTILCVPCQIRPCHATPCRAMPCHRHALTRIFEPWIRLSSHAHAGQRPTRRSQTTCAYRAVKKHEEKHSGFRYRLFAKDPAITEISTTPQIRYGIEPQQLSPKVEQPLHDNVEFEQFAQQLSYVYNMP